MASPYRNLNIVENSVIRLDQEEAIRRKLEEAQPVLIRGNPRMGKSSMLYAVQKRFAKELQIRISIDTIGEKTTEDFKKTLEFYNVGSLIQDLDPSQDDEKIESAMKKSQLTPFEYLQDFLKKRGENEIVCIGLDEIISQKGNPEAMAYMASLGDREKYPHLRVAFVLHYSADAEEEWAAVFHGFSTFYMSAISLEQTGALVRQFIPEGSVAFDEECIRKIWEFSGGRPMEINLLCGVLLSPNSPFHPQGRHYTAADINRFSKSMMGKLLPFFENAIRNYETVFEHTLDKIQQALLRRLVPERSSVTPVNSKEKSALETLVHLSWVRKDDSGAFVLNGELFRKALVYYGLA